jgi:8-oxo-dGTP pyrophosphatase MutT (NUDIX family)
VVVALLHTTRDDEPHVWIGLRSDGAGWALFGGKVEADETLRHAASRECLEETGLAVPTETWVATPWANDHLTYDITVFAHNVGDGALDLRTARDGDAHTKVALWSATDVLARVSPLCDHNLAMTIAWARDAAG